MFEDLIAAAQEMSDVAEFPRLYRPHPQPPTRYRDPVGRFEIRFPKGWDIKADRGLHAASPDRECFVRVDLVTDSLLFWDDVNRELGRAGGRVEIIGRYNAMKRQVRGRISLGRHRFAWNAAAFRTSDGVLVVSTAHILGRDNRKTLRNIRRSFRVLDGAR